MLPPWGCWRRWWIARVAVFMQALRLMSRVLLVGSRRSPAGSRASER